MQTVTISEKLELWRDMAESLNELKKNDNILTCLVSEMIFFCHKSYHNGLTPIELNNAENIYFLIHSRAGFLRRIKD